MRLVVVHEKYWLAILHQDKLIEFRSSKQPILLEAGQCLLFARAMRHRRNGKDALVFARVLKAEPLDVDHAREMDKDSIRIAHEIANLSKGCEGIVHQFALKTGVPHFCHVSDLGKTVSFTLPDGNIVHPIFRRPLSLPDHDCDPRERSADEMACADDASTEIAKGDQRKAPDRKRGDDYTKFLSFKRQLETRPTLLVILNQTLTHPRSGRQGLPMCIHSHLSQNLRHELSQILSDARVEREHSQRLQQDTSASHHSRGPRDCQVVS